MGFSKNKIFLNLPEYPGGKLAFKKYLKENLVYPEEAKRNNVHGIVQLIAEIDDNGYVKNVIVEKGIGAGCDEEAVRLIKNVRFGGVKNRGIRLKTRKKFKIEFKLPAERRIKYSLKAKAKPENDNKPPNTSFNYTIDL
ncbi:MAG: energy transducer TonB [Prolixibacteraceae bacterium]|jgi:TonB family protein|nr:energy transducer TonB [Prolixibacteraceae bacterium]NLO03545.1 energy transducer TonB [Bacteroidales bacterium]